MKKAERIAFLQPVALLSRIIAALAAPQPAILLLATRPSPFPTLDPISIFGHRETKKLDNKIMQFVNC
ncbi:MAG: hypothetical protein JRJ29_21565 [Deltaproteobacteria bacterium]|nr:hypothetical protein [Deltaproteobacteria bacterium]